MRDVLDFAEIAESDSPIVGGKSSGLAFALRHGLPVPGGFCVTAEAYRRHGEGGRINDLLWNEIATAYHRLGSPTVAVRSSATDEDGAETSFAGQQQTILGVTGEAELRSAIEQCWSSLHTERAIAYRLKQGVAGAAPAMAVVVQRLIESEVAGVLFTTDPFDVNEESIRIEASWGLGESVVSGKVTPDLFVLSKATGSIIQKQPGNKNIRFDCSGEREVESQLRNRLCLDDSQLNQLAQLARKVEVSFGGPRDVEWAFKEGQCWLLQARPITTITAKEREHARVNAIAKLQKLVESDGTVWSHTNLKEILKTPTPMTWSLVDGFLLAGGGGSGKMLRDVGYVPDPALDKMSAYDLIGGRPYLNLAREPRLQFAKPLFKYPLAKYKETPHHALMPIPDTSRMHGGFGKWLRIFRMLRIATKIASGSKSFANEMRTKIFPEFLLKAEEFRKTASKLSTSSEVIAALKPMVRTTLVEFAANSQKPTLYSEYSWKFLEQQFIKSFGAEKSIDMLNRLTQGVRPDPEADFPTAMNRVAMGELSRDDFLKQFGHRGASEMELSSQRWSEDSSSLNELLAGEGNSEKIDTLKVWEGIAAEGKWNAYLAKSMAEHADRVRTYVTLRETAKHYFMLGYFEIRRLLLKLDEMWKLHGGIFFLRFEELEQVENGTLKDIDQLIKARKRERHVELSLELPSVIFGDDLQVIGKPLPPIEGATELKGLALSAGVAEGPALVLSEPLKTPLPQGYVLVCPSTDPAWVPLFVPAVALVMESGGTLSHGAIVAREFGLPAVAGIPDLMRRVETGRRIRVDGSQGVVTLL